MFSPAERRSRAKGGGAAGAKSSPQKLNDKALLGLGEDAFGGTPSTPLPSHRFFPSQFSTPAASVSPSASWAHRSVSAVRSPPVLRSVEKGGTDNSHPVFVSDIPQELRNTQADGAANSADYRGVCGGIDQKTGLSWMLRGTYVFVWSYLSSQAPENVRILRMPSDLCTADGGNIDSKHGDKWAACIVVAQKETQLGSLYFGNNCKAGGLVMCSCKSSAIIYWPDIFSEEGNLPVVSLSSGENIVGEEKPSAGSTRKSISAWSGASSSRDVNSLLASAYTSSDMHSCVAMACRSNGELWRFDCSSKRILRNRIGREVNAGAARGELGKSFFIWNSSDARSMVWHRDSLQEGWKLLLLLTATGLECWDVELDSGRQVSLAWSFNVLADLDKSKILAGQKQVWLLDVQLDVAGETLKLLLASYSKDRIKSSNYMQYFLATYSCHSNFAQREGDIQVILPKARIEEEEFLYSMRLRVGGKPEGSVMILARDGTATVAHCNGGTIRLYQFDLAWDAGKVLDACVLPSAEDSEDGSWLVLTEKAGVWAIPGKAVLLCGVEPPERSLSRKGSQNEGTIRDERRWTAFGDTLTPGRTSSEIGELGGRSEGTMLQVWPVHNEEVEALAGRLFQEFVASGNTVGVLAKLKQAGAFEKEGEMSAFALTSRSLVDTLAKHWTTGVVANMAVMAAVSSQLAEKQRRHQQFLQFLSASKCHMELQERQRSALHVIMEHGEKLAAVVWLREMHNRAFQSRLQSPPEFVKSVDTTFSELGGALWDLVQLVGEKARRNNVMLMDREKAEVFYSRVSDLEDFFSCIHMHVDMVVGRDQPLPTQIERTCEISQACSKAMQTVLRYRDAQQQWYPSPEGLIPWYCKPVVRSGLWKLAVLILELKEEASVLAPSIEVLLIAHLEELADILLEAYAGAITAKVEREEDYRGLQGEYWSRRDTLLGAIYQHAKGIAGTANQGIDGADGEQHRLDVVNKIYPSLISLARRHAGYQVLWDICIDLNDMDYLRSLMHESMGLKEGRFSNFVFEQCYRNHQYSKLLRLGEEFKEELSAFLQNHKDLLWLHEFSMHRFTLASSTLHWLALSKDEAVSGTTDLVQGNLKDKCSFKRLNLKYRRQLLHLAKLSALAGGDMESEEKALRIDADIGILSVQEAVNQLGLVKENDILTPRQLVEVCLKSESRELVLRAFDVFAWSGDIFRRSNKSLLESSWLRAADQDDWILMTQVSERDGWSDEQHLEALQNTALFHAANRCYGKKSLDYGGSFQDVLPLLQEMTDSIVIDGIESGVGSVEMVLTQHPDFPVAGQTMLTAIRMGNCVVDGYDKDMGDVMES